MTVYEYELKTIHGMEYRKHANTYQCWEDALSELGFEKEEMDCMTIEQIKQACRSLGAPLKYDEIYANPDFIQLMVKDWNEIGYKLQGKKKVNGFELTEYLIAFSQEMETLMSNLALEGKICDWSTKTWIKSNSQTYQISELEEEKPTLADLNI